MNSYNTWPQMKNQLNLTPDKISLINYIESKYMDFLRNLNNTQGETLIPAPRTQSETLMVPSRQPLQELPRITLSIESDEPIDRLPFEFNASTNTLGTPRTEPLVPLLNDFSYNKLPDIIVTKDKYLVRPSMNTSQINRIFTSSSLPISPNDLQPVVNPMIAINNLIGTEEQERNEGNKIINWLKAQLGTYPEIVNNLDMRIHKGYVHIFRTHIGAPIAGSTSYITQQPNMFSTYNGLLLGQDRITELNIPNIKYFKWQYGLPIDYDTLKYVITPSDVKRDITQNRDQYDEARRILMQEYLIAIQVDPFYVMWFVKRLIEYWYADPILDANIRKIKVLINLYRARGDEQYNKINGVLPMIVVYPKYGQNSAEIVIKKILYYFWNKIPTDWKSSTPNYFMPFKNNNFLYYTNGQIYLNGNIKNMF